MSDFVVYDFRMDAWQPDTLPMRRLAEYVAELAKLFGSSEHVHLIKVRSGSAVPEIAVDPIAQASVAQRLALVGTPQADRELTRHYRTLNALLREDGCSAVLKLKHGDKVLDFPGSKTLLTQEIVTREFGTLDGVVIRVGGKDDTVPVWLEGEGGEKLQCSASRSTAKELAPHLFGGPVRVSGDGRWRRDAERVWTMESFVIKSWERLDDRSLETMVLQAREVLGNGWADLDDPLAEWHRIRGGE
ncbi:hypothetical protein [Rhizobacter sp. OV335]|uniref:hypothetical protein n=1 Tax=Rhizobacter sp. OV335 TaxID=1500264 RepID=UPI000913C562|nr:hypothetical protein [Rhizobacter sp. OV335]SHM13144.1 hypothetical protein SAMN02787076_00576 [Rhizobacter sp. OV335]